MTVKELLANRKAIYLFTRHGWSYYAYGSRFYKIREDVVLAAER